MKKKIKIIEMKEEKYDYTNLFWCLGYFAFSIIMYACSQSKEEVSLFGVKVFFVLSGGFLFGSLNNLIKFFKNKKIVWIKKGVKGL